MRPCMAPRQRSADFQVCCVAGFQTCGQRDNPRLADLEIGVTAGLETCATEGSAPGPAQGGGLAFLQSARPILAIDIPAIKIFPAPSGRQPRTALGSQFSSVVEQRFCKPSVLGSNPRTGSNDLRLEICRKRTQRTQRRLFLLRSLCLSRLTICETFHKLCQIGIHFHETESKVIFDSNGGRHGITCHRSARAICPTRG